MGKQPKSALRLGSDWVSQIRVITGLRQLGIYYFHIRDHLGLVEDKDGIELDSLASLMTEVLRSSNELSGKMSVDERVRFEITDADGRIVLVSPLQGGEYWDLLARARAPRLIQ